MHYKTLTDDLGIPAGSPIALAPDTAKQYLDWGLVEIDPNPPTAAPEGEKKPPDGKPEGKPAGEAK
jgi:hypothetical protein